MDENVREEKDLIKFLKKVPIFKELSRSDLKHLRQYIYTRKYEAGEEVFKKGYPNVIFYIVKEGELKVFLKKKNEEVELNRVKPFEQFGSFGLFKDVKRTASVSAIEDSVLLGISKKDLATFVHKFPQAGVSILYELGCILSEHVVNLNDRIENE
jgi:CRP-like cAMP-binding protein